MSLAGENQPADGRPEVSDFWKYIFITLSAPQLRVRDMIFE